MPAAKAIGTERRRAATAAVKDVNTIMWNVSALRSNMGAINTPANPASAELKDQTMRDDRSVSMPRRRARTGRSTPALVSRPSRVRRIRYQSPPAAAAAATTTANWSEVMATPWVSWKLRAGTGPSPGGLVPD